MAQHAAKDSPYLASRQSEAAADGGEGRGRGERDDKLSALRGKRGESPRQTPDLGNWKRSNHESDFWLPLENSMSSK